MCRRARHHPRQHTHAHTQTHAHIRTCNGGHDGALGRPVRARALRPPAHAMPAAAAGAAAPPRQRHEAPCADARTRPQRQRVRLRREHKAPGWDVNLGNAVLRVHTPVYVWV
jgi:hypothetical protein